MNIRDSLQKKLWAIGVSASTSFCSTQASHAASYAIDWNLIGSGGRSQGGTYEVSGSIFTPATPQVTGGAYEVYSGFWAIVMVFQTPEAPSLQIVRNGNFLTVSWPGGTSGYILEETTSLTTPISWQPATGVSNNSLTFPLVLGAKFYRLKKL